MTESHVLNRLQWYVNSLGKNRNILAIALTTFRCAITALSAVDDVGTSLVALQVLNCAALSWVIIGVALVHARVHIGHSTVVVRTHVDDVGFRMIHEVVTVDIEQIPMVGIAKTRPYKVSHGFDIVSDFWKTRPDRLSATPAGIQCPFRLVKPTAGTLESLNCRESQRRG